MSNVLQFPSRSERLPRPAPAQASWPNNDGIERDDLTADLPFVRVDGKAIVYNRERPTPAADVRPIPAPAIDNAMLAQDEAAMQVISTLAFYAGQGHDHGERARAVLAQIHHHVGAANSGARA